MATSSTSPVSPPATSISDPEATLLYAEPTHKRHVSGAELLLTCSGPIYEWQHGSRVRVIKYSGVAFLVAIIFAVAIVLAVHYTVHVHKD